ncbi:MAG: tetratricopeptide repeat protein, partial [Sulfuricella sp.]
MKRPGRNEPCHCGSGIKFKQCCASHDEALASNANAKAASQKFHASQSLQSALAHHQAGRLPQAEEIYRQILQIQPNHSNALHLLGVLAHQAGQNKSAADLINKAIQADPTNSTFHDHLGTVYQKLNRLGDAVACYQRALALKPGEAETYYNLGNTYRDQGKRDKSVTCYQKSLALKPDYADAHNNLGNAFRDQGKLAEAVSCFQKALAIKPDYADALNNLGNAYNDLGRLEEAIACGQQALALKPDSAEVPNNLGNALYAQGNLAEAADRFRQALALKPDYAEAYNNLGNVLKDQDKLDEAVACFHKAAALKPDFVEAFNNLGAAFGQAGLFGEAIKYSKKALEIDPHLTDGYNNLGMALCGQGQISEAIASYRTALEIDRYYSKAHCNLIFAMDMATGSDTATLQQERKSWGEIHATPLAAKQRPHTNATDPARRLRIGYVSADFRRHSATTAFGAMLVKFDRDSFEVFAYSNSPKEDDYTQLFQQNVTAWRKIVGLSDDAVAEMIREDGIDILVDLSGHTAGNRLLAFARKPAPVQVTAWGSPTGTGMQAMDALFADPVVIPPEEKQFYAEQVRYLPNVVGFFSPETFPAVGALPALSAKIITFGSFNRLAKVSQESFELWAQVLAAVPGSRLILKTAELDDAGTRERVSRHFTEVGIEPERIVMLGKTPWQAHMEAFNQVDIALDPFPQGGGVTALEGLMMGVPIVALRCPTFAGRVSASILTTLGLTDWIAETPEQYLEIVIQKARDLVTLADIRRNLRDQFTASAIGNADAYVKAVETEYRQFWQEWRGNSASNSEPCENTLPVAKMFDAPQALKTALAHHQAGRLLQAEKIYWQILQTEPNHPEALHLLGVLAHQAGQNEIAADLINKAIQTDLKNSKFHDHLGTVYQALNRLDEAVACHQQALALKPDEAETHYNLGNTYNNLGKPDEAAACYQKALGLNPDYAEAYNNLGNTFRSQGKLDEAIVSFRGALAINPNYADAYNNLGGVFHDQSKLDEAIACCRKAVALKPDSAEVHNSLGNALCYHGHISEAIACYHTALAIDHEFSKAHSNLGMALCYQGQINEAIACYRTALAIDHGFSSAHSSLIFTLDMIAGLDTPALQQERKRWGEIHAAPLATKQRPHTNIPAPDRRLRIGYASADFRRHSAATAFGAMLVKFDHSRFDVVAYSNATNEDQYTLPFQQNVTLWRNIVGLSDDAVTQLIRDDEIDILVDLSGHTAGNRLLVFARKPAPIQVSAWGYPTGTGIPAMDALFSDSVVIPPEEKSLYTEQVRYLPNVVGFFGQEPFPAVGPLSALAAKSITFGSFNRLAKISRESLELWTRVLAAVPGSRLMLKSAEFDDIETRERVSRHFAEADIEPERLVMLGKTPWHEHMTAFNQVDIALDPFPQGGGVTALEGLMMGVPIVTLRCPTFAGRVSASILTTLGLNDWIAETPEQYLQIAIEKTQNLEALANLRQDLRGRFMSSAIGDADLYVKAVEIEYRHLWQEWCGSSASGSELHENTAPVAEMPHATPTLQAALAHHQAGRLLQAEEIYQQILQAEPNHPEALHLLGMLA